MRRNLLNQVMIAWLPAIIVLNSGVPGLGQPNEPDIEKARAKLTQAQEYFGKAWSDIFRAMGRSFPVPKVVMFRNSQKSGCGDLQKDNGFFCPADNAIYLDAAYLASLMKDAARTLHTDGDYAAIVVGAHELGHAVAYQLDAPPTKSASYRRAPDRAADCFAGVITRRAKTDKLLEDGDLEEGLFALTKVGDAEWWTRTGIDALTPQNSSPAEHGTPEERHAAFLEGYYGGAKFCAGGLGGTTPPTPPEAGNLIKSRTLLPPAPAGAGKGSACKWSSEAGGLRLQTLPGIGDQCRFDLLAGAALPNHVRLDLTVTQLVNATTKRVSSAGLYYGDGRAAAGLTGYGFGVDGNNETIVVLVKNGARYLTPRLSDTRWYGSAWVNKQGENRFTLEIHHEGSKVYFLEYINGHMVGFYNMSSGIRSGRGGVGDQAGVWLGEGFDEALIKDFRVVALPE